MPKQQVYLSEALSFCKFDLTCQAAPGIVTQKSIIGDAVLQATFLIFHLFQLVRFADQFARQSSLAGDARSEFLPSASHSARAATRLNNCVFHE